MGREHERFLQACACGRKLADPLISNPQSRYGMMENDGLKSEVLWVSKLDCARIIPTAEKKIEKDEVARSLTQPIMDAQRQVIIFFSSSISRQERSRIVVTFDFTLCLIVVHAKPTGETPIARHRPVLTAHIQSP